MNYHPDPTDEKAMRIAYLIAGFIQQTLSPDEHEELDRWVTESDENMLLFEELTDEDNIAAGLQKIRERDSSKAYRGLREQLPFGRPKRHRQRWPWLAAASLLVLAFSLWFLQPARRQVATQSAAEAGGRPAADLPPGNNQAVLTLANGKAIVLQNQPPGLLRHEGLATITRDGISGVVYTGAAAQGRAAGNNTLTTPQGGQYSITLTDGTRVWLNAASSLHYPVVFTGTSRVVELTGEAYFEVAHDAAHPFFVRTGGQEIKVLGTRFNVSAYTDNGHLATTLVEGRIQLSVTGDRKILAPGQQALVTNGGKIQLHAADTAAVLAWKEGLFRFRNATIQEVMKEIGRWYKASVVYEGAITSHFNGEIARNLPASKVLALLQKTGSVKFRITGNTITVTP